MRMPGRFAVDVARHHRSLCLLQLQEDDIGGTAPLEQGDVAAQADATDANHFSRHIDQRVTGDHMPPMRGQRDEIVVECPRDPLRRLAGDARDQRRVIDDSSSRAAHGGQPRQCAIAGPAARHCDCSGNSFTERFLLHRRVQLVHVHPLKGARQQWLVRKEPDELAVRGDARHHRVATARFRHAVLAARDPETDDQPPEVPLPWTWVRLVEVVQVDHEVSFGRGIQAEIAQVRVAADDRGDARRLEPREVVGHDDRGATQKAVG